MSIFYNGLQIFLQSKFNRLLLSALLFVLINTHLHSQEVIAYHREFNVLNTLPRKIIPTAEGGYMIAGGVYGSLAGSTALDWDMMFIKTDFAGNTQFTSRLRGGDLEDQFSDVIQTKDKGYVFLGHSQVSSSDIDVMLVKYDSCGTLQWHKRFGGPFIDMPRVFIVTSDNHFVITGHSSTASGSTTSRDPFLMKIDAQGNFLWSKSYGLTGVEDFACDVIESSFGGYVMTGRQLSNKSFVIKTDKDGNVEWGNQYMFGSGKTIRQMKDGNYVVFLGGGGPFSEGGKAFSLMKLKPNGTVLSYRDHLIDITPALQSGCAGGCLTSDGGMAMIGYTASRTKSNSQMELVILKTDSDGKALWAKSYFSANQLVQSYVQQEIGNISETPDDGFIFAAQNTQALDKAKIYLIKTDKDGFAGCGTFTIPTRDTSSTYTVTPYSNPRNNGIVALSSSLVEVASPAGITTENNMVCSRIVSPTDTTVSDGIIGKTEVCTPGTYSYTIPKLGPGHQYNWATNSGSIVSGASEPLVQVKFNTKGTATVSLLLTSPCGKLTQHFQQVNLKDCSLPLTGTIVQNDASCSGTKDGSATVQISGGVPPYTYKWNTIPEQNTQTAISLAPGTYNVIVTDANNNQITKSVTIAAKSASPNADFTLSKGGLSVAFKDNSTDAVSYLWDFGDGKKSIVANPTNTYGSVGKFKVCLTVTNSANCTDSACKIVDILPTSLNDITAAGFRIYPNPFKDQLVISIPDNSLKITDMEVYDLTGRMVLRPIFNQASSDAFYTIDLSAIDSSAYFLRVLTNQKQYFIPVLKTK